jgi:Fe-S-cluster-containing dehydrogenase component/anaerobic selenocysteine-containing dehydrogenase
MDRRTFLRWIAGASAGASGAGFMHSHDMNKPPPAPAEPSRIGQKLPDRWISSATEQPYIKPGLWTIFATTCRECPAGCGMHVRTREGRVVKPEGNPDHPINHGGLCPRGQSAPQGLYDPDRVRGPLRAVRGQTMEDGGQMTAPSSGFESLSWPQALVEVGEALKNAKRLFLVSDLQTGTLAEILQQFHTSLGRPGGVGTPNAKDRVGEPVAFYEAFDYQSLRTVNEQLFGRAALPRYRLLDCDFILSFGADFLETWISNVEYAWQFAQMHHRGPEYRGEMVYLGPKLSMTAANADHFLPIPAGQEHQVATAILQEVTRLRGSSNSDSKGGAGLAPQFQAVARRFASAKNAVALGGPVGAAGPAAESLAAAVMQLNRAVGAVGRTVDFSQTHALSRTTPVAQLEQMLAGLAPDDVLIVHQTNPAYSLPRRRRHLERVNNLVYIGTMANETARMARWILPVHSPLEAWGDYEPWTGIHCLMQPTMGALHNTRHSGDVFLALAEQSGRPLQKAGERVASFHDWLRLNWRQLHGRVAPDTEFEQFWRQSLQRGGFFEEPARAKEEAGPTSVRPAQETQIAVRPVGPVGPAGPPQEAAPGSMQLWLWPSIKLFDGRLANRGWLQEVPERMSTIAWGGWVDISPAKAWEMNAATGDVLEIVTKAGSVKAPARVTDEVADNVAALAFGQGHTVLGEVARGVGVNAFELQGGSDGDSLFGAVELRKTGEHSSPIFLSATQDQHGRGIVNWTTPESLRALTKNDIEEIIWPGPRGYDPHRDLYAPHEYPEHRWAMVVDLDRCIGCGACSVACYAENNIPVVGPGPLGLVRNREMTWLRVPPYRHPEESLRVGFLPLPCQHCDAAPCEPVCPVFAAVHNDQGLNAQIYNRCIGTRYCSNNCPYKVRRFNWFDPYWREPLQMQLNPDVTVRCRGVMEKCTFCVQRIHYHERQAKVEGRSLRDGEVQPACVQSCPTRTFVFGDLMQPGSEVSKFFENPRRYQLLRELNTKPAVIYLKRIKPQQAEIT